MPDTFALAQLNVLLSWVVKERRVLASFPRLPGRVWSKSPNVQLPASILPFHVALLLAVNYCKDKLLYANSRLNLLSFQHFLFELLKKGLQVPSFGLWLCECPSCRLGVLVRSGLSVPGTVSDGIDKTRGWVICAAGSSSTKWGLFWLMNVELFLSNSTLCPALQMSILARG